MPIFGKFDPRAKQVLDIAQQTAINLRRRFWGTEHLLIGLLARAADDLPGLPDNITLESVQEAVKQLTSPSQLPPKVLDWITPASSKPIAVARCEASMLLPALSAAEAALICRLSALLAEDSERPSVR